MMADCLAVTLPHLITILPRLDRLHCAYRDKVIILLFHGMSLAKSGKLTVKRTYISIVLRYAWTFLLLTMLPKPLPFMITSGFHARRLLLACRVLIRPRCF